MIRTKAATTNEETTREAENRQVALRAAHEAIVLLENDGVLPLSPGPVALFGAGARRTIKGGTGSGEVNERFSISIEEGLKQRGFSVRTESWLDDYDLQFQEGLYQYRREVKRKLRTLNFRAFSNLMANPYQQPYGREISSKDIENSQGLSCIYVISRQAGEGADRRIEDHHISLSPLEELNLRICGEAFAKTVVVINVGGFFGTSFMEEIPGLNGLVHMAQLGTMGGLALANVLSGEVSPSAKLSDTWPKRYGDTPFAQEFSYLNGNLDQEDYREGIYVGYRYFDSFKVEPRYAFGFGLSYTRFSMEARDIQLTGTSLQLKVQVKNEGEDHSGKEVVQLYVSCPQSDLPKEYQNLAGFAKTDVIPPGGQQELSLEVDLRRLASYHEDRGVLGLSPGDYLVHLGNSSKNTRPCAVIQLKEEILLSIHENLCPVQESIQEIEPAVVDHGEIPANLPVLDLNPQDFSTQEHKYDVDTQQIDRDIQDLVNSLSVKELIHTVCGSGIKEMFFGGKFFSCPGAVGNSSSMLAHRGLPNVTFADGPAGLRLLRRSALNRRGKIRMIDAQIEVFGYLPRWFKAFLFGNEKTHRMLYQFTTAFPVAIAMAQTWNTQLLEEMGRAIDREMTDYGVTFWLGPGLNIHRNLLCGRNFEYYSEDPLLSGMLAGAIARGCQSTPGHYATLKHYIANNQEDNRNAVSSNINQRALREIYLKGFKIALEESGAKAVMTSYNRLNGVYTPNSHDLCTSLLRGEWNFQGVVMTDWVSTGKGRADEGLCLKAGNDLLMPGGSGDQRSLRRALRRGVFSMEDLRRSSANVLQAVKNSYFARQMAEGATPWDELS